MKNGTNGELRSMVEQLKEKTGTRRRFGVAQWIEVHPECELIHELIDSYVTMRENGTCDWSYDRFVAKMLKPKYGFPYRPGALRSYVEAAYGPFGARKQPEA